MRQRNSKPSQWVIGPKTLPECPLPGEAWTSQFHAVMSDIEGSFDTDDHLAGEHPELLACHISHQQKPTERDDQRRCTDFDRPHHEHTQS
jgi:hypothetical protein